MPIRYGRRPLLREEKLPLRPSMHATCVSWMKPPRSVSYTERCAREQCGHLSHASYVTRSTERRALDCRAMVRRTSALLLAQSVAACAALMACGSPRAELGPMDPHTDADGTSADDAGAVYDAAGSEVNALNCGVIAPTACPDPPVRYPDVEPIFRTRCVICHDTNS